MAVLQVKKFEANSTTSFSARWCNDETGEAWELEDAIMSVKREDDDEIALFTASVGNSMIDLEAVTADPDTGLLTVGGWANVNVPPSAVQGLDYYGGGVWDLTVKRSVDGHWKRLLEGQAIISRGVSSVE